jgi:uncharacterized coiled-coil protein SlyX
MADQNYTEFDEHIIDDEPLPKSTNDDADSSEDAINDEMEQSKPNKRLRNTLWGVIALPVIVGAFFIDWDDAASLFSKIEISSINNNSIKKELWADRIAELEAQNKTQIQSLDGKFNEVYQEVNELSGYKGQVSDINNVAGNNQQAIAMLSQSLSEVISRISALENMNARTTTVENTERVVNSAIAGVNSNIYQLSANIRQLQANLEKQQRQLDALLASETYEKPPETHGNNLVKNATPAVEKIPVKTDIPWQLKAADYRKKVAVLFNKITGTSITVSLNSKVPECGVVTDIAEESKAVVSTTCVINKG